MWEKEREREGYSYRARSTDNETYLGLTGLLYSTLARLNLSRSLLRGSKPKRFLLKIQLNDGFIWPIGVFTFTPSFKLYWYCKSKAAILFTREGNHLFEKVLLPLLIMMPLGKVKNKRRRGTCFHCPPISFHFFELYFFALNAKYYRLRNEG